MTEIACTNCRRPYPQEGLPYCCPTCGGLFDFTGPPAFDPAAIEPGQPGLWRYRHSLGLPPEAPVVYLGEGRTPLAWGETFGRRVAFKLEYQNPTGSFKDRGSAVLVSYAAAHGSRAVVEDSSGNAGASLAAYAARAGMTARVFVPEAAAGPKRRQIAAYGAEVVSVDGPRSNAAAAVQAAAKAGARYLSHAYLPFNLLGYATLAYELVEQLDGAPGTIVLPVGQGGLLLGVWRGCLALQAAGVIRQLPRLVGVQARACAPLWALAAYGPVGLGWVTEGQTLAEGVRVYRPLRGSEVLQAVQASGGQLLAVDEEALLPGRDALARQGFYIEPTSALVWEALQHLSDYPDPVAAVLTGAGLKYHETANQ
jgi:threonine synthase